MREELIQHVRAQDRRVQDLRRQLYDAVERRKHLEDEPLACSEELGEQRMTLKMNVALNGGCSRNFEYFDVLEDQQDVATRIVRRDVAQECAEAAHAAMVRLDGVNRIYLEESSLEVQRGIAAIVVPAP